MPEFLHGIETVEIDSGLRPIRTVMSSIIGLVGTAPAASEEDFPLDTPVLLTGPRKAATLGAGGTLRDAYDAIYAQGVNIAIVVRVAEGATPAATTANVAGQGSAGTGAYAFLTSESQLGIKPKILAAPGFTANPAGGTASPVTTALIAVADRTRSVAIVDGPNTGEAAAVADAGLYGSARVMIVDPAVRVMDQAGAIVTRPASGYAAGVLSRTDAERGFWWSPSNQLVNGIVGTARPISFELSSDQTEAHRLNAADVATIINRNGFRLWGNRTPSEDPLWAFLSVRRTADMVYESVEQAHLWAMDRPFGEQLLIDIRDSVQTYLNELVRRGAILGGQVWLDPELNTEATMKAGKLYIDFDIEPPAPLEHLIFRAHRNGSYYEELVTRVAATN